MCKPGSVGDLGGQPPRSTRPEATDPEATRGYVWQRCHPTGEERSLLAAWPIDTPANWLERVNQTDDAQKLETLRRMLTNQGRPFGQPEWQKEIAKRLGLESAYRPTGRPRKVGRNQNASPG